MSDRDEFFAAMAELNNVPCKDTSHVAEIRTALPGREPKTKPPTEEVATQKLIYVFVTCSLFATATQGEFCTFLSEAGIPYFGVHWWPGRKYAFIKFFDQASADSAFAVINAATFKGVDVVARIGVGKRPIFGDEPICVIRLEGVSLRRPKRSDLFEWLARHKIRVRMLDTYPDRPIALVHVDADHAPFAFAALKRVRFKGAEIIAYCDLVTPQ